MWFDLPATYRCLTSGSLSEHKAELVVSETRHLDAQTRRGVDAAVVAAGICELGVRAAAACAHRCAYAADPEGYLGRGRTERKHRRVGLRPAPDTMAILSGYLPVEQGVACYAALRRHADATVATGDSRTRDQIMADTLVERLTGQARAIDVSVELQLLMPVDALTSPDSGRMANLSGCGPLPADLAREFITNSEGRKSWRRLFTAPTGGTGRVGPVVVGGARRRRFDGWLADLIRLRDSTCRDPYCDAAIRHVDHVDRWSSGGQTTLANGRGVCERGNYVRELPGWEVTLVRSGLDGTPHTTVTTTPTGHRYLSRAPDPP